MKDDYHTRYDYNLASFVIHQLLSLDWRKQNMSMRECSKLFKSLTPHLQLSAIEHLYVLNLEHCSRLMNILSL